LQLNELQQIFAQGLRRFWGIGFAHTQYQLRRTMQNLEKIPKLNRRQLISTCKLMGRQGLL
jgi:hypothetical protein